MSYRIVGEGGRVSLLDGSTGKVQDIVHLPSQCYANYTTRSSPSIVADVRNLMQSLNRVEVMTHGHTTLLDGAYMAREMLQYLTRGSYRNLTVLEVGSGWGGLTYVLAVLLKSFSSSNYLIALDRFSGSVDPETGEEPASLSHLMELLSRTDAQQMVSVWDADRERVLPLLHSDSIDIVVVNPSLPMSGVLHEQIARILKTEGVLYRREDFLRPGVLTDPPIGAVREAFEKTGRDFTNRVAIPQALRHSRDMGSTDNPGFSELPPSLKDISRDALPEVLERIQTVALYLREHLGIGYRGSLKWGTMALKARLLDYLHLPLAEASAGAEAIDEEYIAWRRELLDSPLAFGGSDL